MAAPLRVILNDRPLRTTLTGVGHYIRQLLLHLAALETPPQVDPFLFTYVFRRDWRQAGGGAGPADGRGDRGVGASRKPWWVRRVLDAGLGAAFRLTAGRYQLYHEPNHVPIRCDRPTVTTIHDLSVVVHPDWHPPDRVRWYEHGFARGVAQTQRFLAASEFTKRELAVRCGVPAERVDVTYQGPRAAFGPQPEARVQAVLARYGLRAPFFLYVGTLEPRKNLPGLLEAFAGLPADVRRRHPLVIAGAWGWKQAVLREKLAERHLAEDVRLLGYVEDEALAGLYAACTALVWPTLYEGFGLPPLEAMACGAPVVVSDVASLPEVVGAAGVRLDPYDVAGWGAALRRMAEDAAWRRAWVAAGAAQAARFSWARCAMETLASYEKVVETA